MQKNKKKTQPQISWLCDQAQLFSHTFKLNALLIKLANICMNRNLTARSLIAKTPIAKLYFLAEEDALY